MVLAMAAFVSNDTCVKLVGRGLPVGELMGLRGLMSMALIAAIAAWQGVLGDIAQIGHRRVMLRAGLDLLATVGFITALLHMELANLTAIMQAVPLAVAFLSRAVLGERVGTLRAVAIAVGFAGVLLIVRPSPIHFSAFDGLALLIVLAVAARDLVTRTVPAHVPSLIVALANASFVTAGGWILVLFEGFVAPTAQQMALLVLAAVFLACGYMAMVATLRLGALATTAPFRYSILLFAILYGMAVFGEFPDRWAIAGMVLIVAAGLTAARQTLRAQT
jgi:drug/metabolite transporter (DMT)-like permease